MTFKETLLVSLKVIAIFFISVVGFFAMIFTCIYMAYLFSQATAGSGICSM